MDMFTIILFVLGLGTGILFGGFLAIEGASGFQRVGKLMGNVREKGRPEKKENSEESIEEWEEEPEEFGLLKERLGKKKGTWTELNCSADEQSEEVHIKGSRKKQNDAYRYFKRKKR